MNRKQRRLLNVLTGALLAFALYLNFFYKESKEPRGSQELKNQTAQVR